ncbi:uncharacterized protein LOC129615262 [Condylostylus longicornis]|uniref:uncharacterized protein LOC129615262 n=1 Tax=Condylostylus longicornis TaxID=2530218 RepID=UPI00244DC0C6|nr:uncharacterized protein LOC129615262 [Condylostylus longicornis]
MSSYTFTLAALLLSLTLFNNLNLYANAKNVYSPCGAYIKDQSIIEPFFEIYKLNGIRISIPMLDFGMKSFKFHANINELISLDEPGTINGEAKYSKYTNQWNIYLENHNLNVGDRINYWYEININDTTKRYQKVMPYIVQYLIPVPPNFHSYHESPEIITTTLSTPIEYERTTTRPTCSIHCNTDEIRKLQNEISFLRNELNKVQQDFIVITQEIDTLKKKIQYENIDENIDNESTELLLTSKKPFPYNNAIDDVRFIISEKLHQSNLELKIVQARYTRCGILFEMISPNVKRFLLSQAQKNFSKNYHIQIKEPSEVNNCIDDKTAEDENDEDISIHSRID